MKKYILQKNTFVLDDKDKYSIGKGISSRKKFYCTKKIDEFNSLVEALKKLNKYTSAVRENNNCYCVEEYVVQEAEYDDGEFIYASNLEFSKMIISVVDNKTSKTIATFDNYDDALDFIYDNDDKNLHISFNK